MNSIIKLCVIFITANGFVRTTNLPHVKLCCINQLENIDVPLLLSSQQHNFSHGLCNQTLIDQTKDDNCSDIQVKCCYQKLFRAHCDMGINIAQNASRNKMLQLVVSHLPLARTSILRALLRHCTIAKFDNKGIIRMASTLENCCICHHVEQNVNFSKSSKNIRILHRMCQKLGCCSAVNSLSKIELINDRIEDKLQYECSSLFHGDLENDLCINNTYKQCDKICEQHKVPNLECQTGYDYSVEQNKCIDIDECSRNVLNVTEESICFDENTRCENFPGSYRCACLPGYSRMDDGTCHDVDECSPGALTCSIGQICINTIGSFRCMRKVPCGFGYTLNEATQECEDVDECKITPNICQPDSCENLRGSFFCQRRRCENNMRHDHYGKCTLCEKGFRMMNSSCIDINECNEIIDQCSPNEICFNSFGGYRCEAKKNCASGSKLKSDGSHCEDVNECFEGTFTCKSTEICINRNSGYNCTDNPCGQNEFYAYLKARCECLEGYSKSNEKCSDINECTENDKTCEESEICINTNGSFTCVLDKNCKNRKDSQKKYDEDCIGYNDCANGLFNCPPGMICSNSNSSFSCNCPRGYLQTDYLACQDINECLLYRNEELCRDNNSKCLNTAGSFKCICPIGFIYIELRKQCVDIDECATKINVCGSPFHECVNTIGHYYCICQNGYEFNRQNDECMDINECSSYNHNLTKINCPNGFCNNLDGHFECLCPRGYKLNQDALCIDIQECQEMEGICHSNSHVMSQRNCLNLRGSYRCIKKECPSNYEKMLLSDGYRCKHYYNCLNNSIEGTIKSTHSWNNCDNNVPFIIDKVFVEIITFQKVPHVVYKINPFKILSGSKMRADVREHYSYNLDSKLYLNVRNSFKLRMSSMEKDKLELVLFKQLTESVEILLSIYLLENDIAIYEVRLYIFVTNTAEDIVKRRSIVGILENLHS